MLSTISLFGLYHKIDIQKLSGDVEDGAGGISPNYVILLTDWPCRITTLHGDNEQFPAGLGGENRWGVVAEYSSEIKKDLQIVIVDTETAEVAPAGTYRILWTQPRLDYRGGFHHTSIVMEFLQ